MMQWCAFLYQLLFSWMFDSQNKATVPLKHSLNIENSLIFVIGSGDFIGSHKGTSHMVEFRSVKFNYNVLINNSF
jgi:hypothetical protein